MAWSGENFILELGLIGAAFLAVHRIAHGSVPVGSFAMLIYYWSNFSGRLDQLIGTRREFLAELVDAEALRELFEKSPTRRFGRRNRWWQIDGIKAAVSLLRSSERLHYDRRAGYEERDASKLAQLHRDSASGSIAIQYHNHGKCAVFKA